MKSIGKRILLLAQKSLSSFQGQNVLLNSQTVRCCHVIRPPPYTGFIADATKDDSPIVTHSNLYKDVDPAPFFMDGKVQSLLKNLTGCDKYKVFRHRKLMKRVSAPSYVFLTTEQLEKAQTESDEKAERLLQMPPVMRMRIEDNLVICRDPALQGLDQDKIIFTDISLGITDRKRVIVVRESDGTLRHAKSEERHRMNQIYNPRIGRTLRLPEMFTEKRLKSVLERGQYEFALERNCVQMDPDNPTYQSVAAGTYETADANRQYDALHSTRHYGPMVFYLVWHRKIDNLLEHFIQKDRLESACDTVMLYALLHPASHTAAAAKQADNSLQSTQLLEFYINEESKTQGPLSVALRTHLEAVRARADYDNKLATALGQDQL